jgi:hypothetical protein
VKDTFVFSHHKTTSGFKPEVINILKNIKNQFMITTKKSILLALLLGLGAMLTQTKLNAQEKTNKYEIAMDLKGFFSDGYPEKVLFKINNINNNQIIGAYRFSVGSWYWIDKYKITQDNENYDLTAKNQQGNFSLSLGYEFQKQLNRAVFYYGADLGALVTFTDDMDFPHVAENYNLFFVPFAGVKVFITNNLSIAFEAGLKNFYWWNIEEGGDVNPDNRQYHSYYLSKLELPYSLTFNFNF